MIDRNVMCAWVYLIVLGGVTAVAWGQALPQNDVVEEQRETQALNPKVQLVEVDFVNAVGVNGNSLNNNFKFSEVYYQKANENSTEVVPTVLPNHDVEWNSKGQRHDSIYIKNTYARFKATFKWNDPDGGGVPNGKLRLYTSGDIEANAEGANANGLVSVIPDIEGMFSVYFVSKVKLADRLDRKEYVINWEGDAKGNAFKQVIYLFYGEPNDKWNNFVPGASNVMAIPKECPFRGYAQILLGPKIDFGIQDHPKFIGEWLNGTSELKEEEIPKVLSAKILETTLFLPGSHIRGNPWERIGQPAFCEDQADIMREALRFIGVPESKLRRRSITGHPKSLQSWLGDAPLSDRARLVQSFNEPMTGPWLNEGVVGVEVEKVDGNSEWIYYSISTQVKGPGDPSLPAQELIGGRQNMWFNPTAQTPGPIMASWQEVYGWWEPQNVEPHLTDDRTFGPELLGKIKPLQLPDNQFLTIDPRRRARMISVTKFTSDGKMTVRTEGAKDIGTHVIVRVYEVAANGGTGRMAASAAVPIDAKWDNKIEIEFLFEDVLTGRFKVVAQIRPLGWDPDDNQGFPLAWDNYDNDFTF